MRRRTMAAMTLVGALSVTGVARAGCCDDFWSCCAAVASAGLSCQIQSIIDTVKTLTQVVNNLLNDLTTRTAEIVADGRAAVTQAATDILQLSRDASSELSSAVARAHAVANPPAMVAPGAFALGRGGPGIGGGSAPAPGPMLSGAGGAAVAGGGPGAGRTAAAAPELALKAADPGAVKNAIQRADAYVQGLKSKQDAMAHDVEQAQGAALSSLAHGVAMAQQTAVDMAIEPLKLMGQSLADLLAHPDRILDPSAQIDADVLRIQNEVSAMLDRMANQIAAEANGKLEAVHAVVQQMEDQGAAASAIATAMEKVGNSKSQPDLDALNKLLPGASAPGVARLRGVMLPAGIVGRSDLIGGAYARTLPQSLPLATKHKATIADIAARWTAIKGQIRTSPRVEPAHQQYVDQQLSVRFRGKPPAEIQRQKQYLIDEAKKRFANDPKTLQKVLQYIETHSSG